MIDMDNYDCDDDSDIDNPNPDDMCPACDGSGEGQYDGTRCQKCNGKGVC